MATSNQELYFEHLKGQSQFAYFQLGLAASAIAFAIHETEGEALADTPWPLGAAVAVWALSFALGCFGVTARQQGMATNIRYLEATQGVSAYSVSDPELRAAMENAKRIAQGAADRPLWRFRWQLWTLFVGALFYIGGHVMQMAATAPKPIAASQQKTVTMTPQDQRPTPKGAER